MNVSPDVVIPEAMTRFKCNEQGCCCKGWTIPFRPADVVKLLTHLPEPERQRLADVRIAGKPGSGGEQLVLAPKGPENACTFLEDDGRCEVHRRFGAGALPRICVNFPAVPYTAGDRVEMHFSLVCPEVLERVAEAENAYEISMLCADDARHVAARAARVTGTRSVIMGGMTVSWERLGDIRAAISTAINDPARPVLEAVADVSYAMGSIHSAAALESFSVPQVADRQAFYDFFSASIHSHAAELLARNLRDYRRFVFDVPRDGDAWGPALEAALSDWEPHYRRYVLPEIPHWLLRRYLAHRYFTVFTNGAGELRFSYGTIVHSFALACRLMAGLCAGFDRMIDVPLAKCALGASEYFHRQLERQIPPEAMPWFVP